MEMIDVLKKLEEIALTKPELVRDAVDNVTRTNPVAVQDNAVKTDEGGMSDVHIGAQEVIGQYADEDGNLKMPKMDVLRAMAAEKEKAAFPLSYEIEVAMGIVNEKFGNDGIAKADMDMNSEQPTPTPTQAPAEELNTNIMKTEDKKQVNESKKPVKESIQISTDSPQEASMMMQLLKLAGVQQVDQDMINQEPEAPAHGEEGHVCGDGEDDAMGSQEMGRMRDIMTAPAEEKAEENFANSMGDEKEEPKIQDTDTLVNTMSGGMNRQKKTYPKVASGDNPMAVEDTITAESLANSLREQYDTFKETYTKVAEAKAKPDFLDMDKDGNKKEPMKKAIKDKEAK